MILSRIELKTIIYGKQNLIARVQVWCSACKMLSIGCNTLHKKHLVEHSTMLNFQFHCFYLNMKWTNQSMNVYYRIYRTWVLYFQVKLTWNTHNEYMNNTKKSQGLFLSHHTFEYIIQATYPIELSMHTHIEKMVYWLEITRRVDIFIHNVHWKYR